MYEHELTAVSEYITSAMIVLLVVKLLLVSTKKVDSMLGEFTLSGKKAEGLNLYSPDGYSTSINNKSLHSTVNRMLRLYKNFTMANSP